MSDGGRLAFLDGFRGVALILMVVNHTARWWIGGPMTWARYELIYVTLSTAAPIFLFLVGFCLPLALRPEGGEGLRALIRRFLPRGARIVLAGLLLNVVVFPGEPILSGGVLQTIGLGIIVMAPAAWLLRHPAGPWVLLAIAVIGYVGFVAAYPALGVFVSDHTRLGLVLFYDFPPWPWLSLVLIGLVLGGTWLRAHRRSPAAGARLLRLGGGVGALMILAFLLYDVWAATPVRFGLRRDFILNRHWTPRGAALLWVFGTLLLGLAVTYWAMEHRRWRWRWLVTLGQSALFLYFLHQILAYRVVQQWLHWEFNAWPAFAAANVAFLVVLLACGRGWRALTSWLARRRTDRAAGGPAESSAARLA